MINTKLTIKGLDITDPKSINLERNIGTWQVSSRFIIRLDNPFGRHKSEFAVNDEVIIFADKDSPATTKIFTGIIEDIAFSGKNNTENLKLTGRDFSSILMDIIVEPRIFKETEVSQIVTDLMEQNIPTITINNVNVTTTTPDKITFNNINMFDALQKLAELSNFIFYVDEDKDLHFEAKESISSGETFDNTNILTSSFKQSDQDLFNIIKVVGNRQLTGANEIFTTGTDNTGSVYILDSKPHNSIVTLSGATNTILQPGGVFNLDDPSFDNVKYLVDFQGQSIVLTSGTIGGDNIQPNGSVIIIDYQRSTPLIKIKSDSASISAFGRKNKTITDTNITDINEANDVADTFLREHKDPKIEGRLKIDDVLVINPGNTAIVDLPFQDINNQTYQVLKASYDFNSTNNQRDKVLSVTLNQKIPNFLDLMKQQALRLRALEGAETDVFLTSISLATGSIGISGTSLAIQTSIGSSFYFHTEGPGGRHDLFDSPSSLLGDMRTGSIVFQDGVEI